MSRNSLAMPGFIWSIVLALAMMGLSYFIVPELKFDSSFGICLPSPNLWNLIPWQSWILNVILSLASAVILVFLIRKFNIVKGNTLIFPMAFIVLTASNFFISRELCSSSLLVFLNLISLGVLFDSYNSPNATQNYFFIATLIALGAMFQYAFLVMIPVYLTGGILLKSLKWKETMAFLLGLIAPYWVTLGLGLLKPEDFSLPELSPIFSSGTLNNDIYIIILESGFFFIMATIICMSNAIILYAGNTRIRLINNVINILGYLSAACMAIDFNNLFSYFGLLYVWIALQIGNLFALRRLHRPMALIIILAAIIIAGYLWTLSNFI